MRAYSLTLAIKLKRLIFARLLVATVFLALAILTTQFDRELLYGSIFSICFLSLIYAIWLSRRRGLVWLGIVQIVLDLLMETFLVRLTGGPESGFAMLYVLTIIAAGIILSPQASFYISIAASLLLLCATVAYVTVFEFIPVKPWVSWQSVSLARPENWLYPGYIFYVEVTIFVLVGFLVRNLLLRMGEMEERIKTQEKLSFLGEAVTSIAHEIRNPLGFISGAVELLERELRDKFDEKQRETVRTIVSESERLGRVFNQILNYSRVDELQLRRFSLGKLVDEVLLLFEQDVKFKEKVTVKKDYQSLSIKIMADRDKLKQVFMNIIVNAFQAMSSGGTLNIEAEEKRGIAEIRFRDTGIGISQDMQRKLFIPFRSSKVQGGGVGLATAYKIVLAHEGTLEVKSKSGKGTVVVVRLPVY
ncbi:MAG: ATP-binding protein [Candidatus Omnitrophica bacterium]|nr:ATP-binding protein [Candidatus Omnitrophota bacterium]